MGCGYATCGVWSRDMYTCTSVSFIFLDMLSYAGYTPGTPRVHPRYTPINLSLVSLLLTYDGTFACVVHHQNIP